MLTGNYYIPSGADLGQPPPIFKTQTQQQPPSYDHLSSQQQQQNLDSGVQYIPDNENGGPDVVEVWKFKNIKIKKIIYFFA